MAIVYQNGTVVSVPTMNFNRTVHRSAMPVDKCFGLAFKTKMKIYDAAHVQHLELSNAMRYNDGNGRVLNEAFNHVFLTPTFDWNNPDSFVDGRANDAIKRFTDNLKFTYGATSYIWVKEFTQNLVPHYHMMLTMPHAPIVDLNRAWSHARGDIGTVKNALRTGWDSRTKKPVMKIRSYKAAVGYAAKYISKSGGGDISVFKSSCSLKDREKAKLIGTYWPASTGHSTKCYGMSLNLHRKPKEIDYWLTVRKHPWLAKEVKEVRGVYADLFFHDNPETANLLYHRGEPIFVPKPVKPVQKIAPKNLNYSRFDQMFLKF